VKSTTVAVVLWLCASVVWGQNVSQGPPELRGPQSGGQVLESPAEPAPGSIQVAQRLKRFDEERPPGSERIPSIPPSEVEDRLIFEPVPDRWRIGYKRNIIDPYNQNVLKGDYPILGQNTFFVFTGISDTLAEFHTLPVPSGISAARPDSFDFFGRNRQIIFRENLLLRFELYYGDTAFKPPDWLLTITPALNLNRVDLPERGLVNADVRRGTTRLRGNVALQEASFEYHIANLSDRYDSVSVKVGIQPFNSDFRSFIFNDTNLGARLFGNLGNNRYQYNLAFFDMLEKETNSELNTTFQRRDQRLVIANVYLQDLFVLGYTTQFNLHYLYDAATFRFDANHFLVRPDPVGVFTPHELNVVYLGWTSTGHIGPINVTHALYEAVGTDTRSPLAGRRVDINAQLAALELSIDYDYLRPVVSVMYASGDANPTNGTARGFDSLFDKPNFAGGEFSFWNRQGVRLLGVGLVQAGSLLPDLRSSKIQGQPNFVNPGLFLLHAGLEAEVTPKLRALLNGSYLRFVTTQPLEHFLQQPKIGHNIGYDFSLGLIYRPLLNNNIILTGGVAAFVPGSSFRDILTKETLFQGFFNARLIY